MRKLLLLLFAASLSTTASAQWSFDTVFPSDTLATDGNGLQGVAVDDDGTVFVQTFGATDSLQFPALGDDFQRIRVLRAFNPDGSEVDDSPITFIDYADGTTPRDTLGGFTLRNDDGSLAFEGRSGRGLRYCAADNALFISQFDTIFKIDADSFEGLGRAIPFPGSSIGAVGVDANCNVTVQSVVAGGNSITQLSSDLSSTLGTVGTASTFTRTILTSPDGNTVFETAFENPFTVVYQRADEFSPYDSLGVTLAGLRVESTAINPRTGRYWFSSGNPLNGGNDFVNPADSTLLETNYTLTAWYAFEPADLFDGDGNPVLNPTPVDSLIYNEPGDGRPRGISFTQDGDTAYVVLFNSLGGVQRFTRGGDGGGTAAEDVATFAGALEQNRPNPFSGTTQIAFDLERAATVTLKVYDTTGREVTTLADGPMVAGPHSVSFDAGSLAAGVYVYSLNVEGEVATRRMMVVR